VVKEGESLGGIAKKYSMSIQDVCRLNGLSENSYLIAGQRIFIAPSQRATIKKTGINPTIVIETAPDSMEEVEESGAELDNFEKEKAIENDEANDEKANIAEENDLSYKSQDYDTQETEFVWPIKGKILKKFNEKLSNNTFSEGINVGAPANVKVRACLKGIVLDAGELVLGFGKMIILSHENGMVSIYGHLQEILVKKPQQGEKVVVAKGQIIGRVGKTGNVRTPQLHFQLRNNKKNPVDPLLYLPK
jgi:murein DD-endopeptidase MepM/ murein hydrolase activator NlpD